MTKNCIYDLLLLTCHDVGISLNFNSERGKNEFKAIEDWLYSFARSIESEGEY